MNLTRSGAEMKNPGGRRGQQKHLFGIKHLLQPDQFVIETGLA